MRNKFLILILILLGSLTFVAQNRTYSKIVSPASTYTINLKDSIIFNLKNSFITSYSNDSSFLNIPVFIKSDDIVTSIDLSFLFDESKLTYESIIDSINTIDFQVFGAFNTNDRYFRLTANTLDKIPNNKTVVVLRFKVLKSCVINIVPGDFSSVSVALNAKLCSYIFTTKTSQSSIQANFNTSSACLNTTVSFTDASFGSSITSWYWKFGNGLFSNLQNPTTTYANSGTYTVSLLVTSGGVCKDSLQKIITVSNPPVSSFSYSISCVKDSVFFINTSSIPTGTITNWSWNFGDGGISSVKNPIHHYNAAGNFIVSLLTTSNASCTSTYTTAIILNKPTANFLVSNSNCQDAIINFTNTSTYTLAPITSYNWDFGDGNISTLQNPTHTYTTSGTYKVLLVCTSTVGCNGSISKIIIINAKPIVQYTASTLSGCSPLAVNFNDQSTTDVGSTYYWVFGDNGNSTIQNPSHAYTNSGIYTIKEVVTTSKGCRDSLIKTSYITVNSTPIVNFSMSNGCINSAISFIDNSAVTSGTITTWNWNFGDGTNSNTQNAIHTYTTAGTYTVILNVSTNQGCSSTLTKTITISSKPIVNFTADNLIGCSPLVVTFTNSTTNINGSTYVWNFGDGGISNLQNPVHTYTTSGLYMIKLLASVVGGCSDSLIKTSYITVNSSPTASFSISNGCVNSAINFSDNSSITSGTITSWNWNFGDGTNSNTQNAMHTYTAAGTYTVILNISTSQGCSSILTKTITISNKPIVSFTADNLIGCSPLVVTFTNSTTNTNGATYVWNFGDGGTSSLQNPVHTFTTNGLYTIKLVATSLGGCSDSLIKSAYINANGTAATANFTVINGCANSVINFTNTSSVSTGTIISVSWNFGDGAISSLQSPTHTYTIGGVYSVTLTVTNSQGCVSIVTKTVTIDNKPKVNFSVDNTDGCYPFEVNFTGLSITTLPSTYLWNFGDTHFSSLKDANNTYTASGSYTIKYIVKTPNGCVDSLIKSNYINVQKPPTALFSHSSNSVLIPNTKILFTNLSSNYTSSLWDFGDYNSSTITNPYHTYSDTGLYKVCLTVVNKIACSSKYCDSVLVIKNGGIVAVPSAFTPNADNINDVLQVKGGPFSQFEFKIFNEWGNILFESKEQKEGWNGYYQGVMQATGTYEYTLKGTTIRNENINLYGAVNLVR